MTDLPVLCYVEKQHCSVLVASESRDIRLSVSQVCFEEACDLIVAPGRSAAKSRNAIPRPHLCMHVYSDLCMYMYIYIIAHTYCVCIHIQMYVCTHVCLSVCLPACLAVCLSVYLSVCAYVSMYVCRYAYTNTYIHDIQVYAGLV